MLASRLSGCTVAATVANPTVTATCISTINLNCCRSRSNTLLSISSPQLALRPSLLLSSQSFQHSCLPRYFSASSTSSPPSQSSSSSSKSSSSSSSSSRVVQLSRSPQNLLFTQVIGGSPATILDSPVGQNQQHITVPLPANDNLVDFGKHFVHPTGERLYAKCQDPSRRTKLGLYARVPMRMLEKWGNATDEELARLVKPKLRNGRWIKPVLSRLQQARLRNALIMRNAEKDPNIKTLEQSNALLPPALQRDPPRKFKAVRWKGTKAIRTRDERMTKIENAMKEMPKKLEEYRKTILQAKHKKEDILDMYFESDVAAQMRNYVHKKFTEGASAAQQSAADAGKSGGKKEKKKKSPKADE